MSRPCRDPEQTWGRGSPFVIISEHCQGRLRIKSDRITGFQPRTSTSETHVQAIAPDRYVLFLGRFASLLTATGTPSYVGQLFLLEET
jgi:hypothetical protein